jgi:hypothetical protein
MARKYYDVLKAYNQGTDYAATTLSSEDVITKALLDSALSKYTTTSALPAPNNATITISKGVPSNDDPTSFTLDQSTNATIKIPYITQSELETAIGNQVASTQVWLASVESTDDLKNIKDASGDKLSASLTYLVKVTSTDGGAIYQLPAGADQSLMGSGGWSIFESHANYVTTSELTEVSDKVEKILSDLVTNRTLNAGANNKITLATSFDMTNGVDVRMYQGTDEIFAPVTLSKANELTITMPDSLSPSLTGVTISVKGRYSSYVAPAA